jgi:hypothetical protein
LPYAARQITCFQFPLAAGDAVRRLLASTGLSQADLMSLSRGKLFDDRDETAGGLVAQPCPRLSDDEGYFINLRLRYFAAEHERRERRWNVSGATKMLLTP